MSIEQGHPSPEELGIVQDEQKLERQDLPETHDPQGFDVTQQEWHELISDAKQVFAKVKSMEEATKLRDSVEAGIRLERAQRSLLVQKGKTSGPAYEEIVKSLRRFEAEEMVISNMMDHYEKSGQFLT